MSFIPKKIIIHCSATRNGRITPIEEIDSWHFDSDDISNRKPEDVKRHQPRLLACGYHFVVHLSGSVSIGRALDEEGCHTRGEHGDSIGICMIGTDKFTFAQWKALYELCAHQLLGLPVYGHREFNSKKTCPGFTVADWLEKGLVPLGGHILQLGDKKS